MKIKIFRKVIPGVFVFICMMGHAQQTAKPNIILLFADDISARELPAYGSTIWTKPGGGNTSDVKYRAETPMLDKIAREGCFIKTAWSSTVCSPSRAMLMTGRYAHIHKWWSNRDHGTQIDENGERRSYPLYESSPLIIGHVAKKGDYATFWAGKVQMNGDINLFGFDEGCFTPGAMFRSPNPFTDFKVKPRIIDGKQVFVNIDNGDIVDSYPQHSPFWKPHVLLVNHPEAEEAYVWWPNTPESIKEYGLNTYGPDVELEFAFDFMERKHKQGKPFFVYHASNLGHDAFDHFNPKIKNMWPGTPKLSWDGKKYHRTKPNITGDNGIYDLHGTVTEPGLHNQVNYLDYMIWMYMEKLEELEITDNTIIIFCTDNGTWSYGKNKPDRQKGVHIPLIIYAPGSSLARKGALDAVADLSDIVPTLAEIADVEIPDDYEINGESLWSYLLGKKEKHRGWIYSYHSEKQLIRGNKVLKDGNNVWYDVEDYPPDLTSFPIITDWSKVSEAHRAERDRLKAILPGFDKYASEHDAPVIQ